MPLQRGENIQSAPAAAQMERNTFNGIRGVVKCYFSHTVGSFCQILFHGGAEAGVKNLKMAINRESSRWKFFVDSARKVRLAAGEAKHGLGWTAQVELRTMGEITRERLRSPECPAAVVVHVFVREQPARLALAALGWSRDGGPGA